MADFKGTQPLTMRGWPYRVMEYGVRQKKQRGYWYYKSYPGQVPLSPIVLRRLHMLNPASC